MSPLHCDFQPRLWGVCLRQIGNQVSEWLSRAEATSVFWQLNSPRKSATRKEGMKEGMGKKMGKEGRGRKNAHIRDVGNCASGHRGGRTADWAFCLPGVPLLSSSSSFSVASCQTKTNSAKHSFSGSCQEIQMWKVEKEPPCPIYVIFQITRASHILIHNFGSLFWALGASSYWLTARVFLDSAFPLKCGEGGEWSRTRKQNTDSKQIYMETRM